LKTKDLLQKTIEWREKLALGFWQANEGLALEDLNSAVQTTLNRLLFWQICANHKLKLSLTATLKLNLRIQNELLQKILEELASQTISLEQLGQIYEQSLGKKFTLSAMDTVVWEKSTARKVGGVYYTPSYIVAYLVKKTLGPLLEGKNLIEIADLKVLDPACGAGSFLLGAYQYLLEWYQQYYFAKGATKLASARNPLLVQAANDEWQLALRKRQEILLHHIYGVDLDRQAIEVTKFSLFLKVLEEANAEISHKDALLLLSAIDKNLKWGNSLIGPDFKSSDLAELERLKPFDWNAEFPQIMQAGGFDVVLGNPPYVRRETLGQTKSYFQAKYRVYHRNADLYTYFIELGVNLLKSGGAFGYLVANKWLRVNYAEALRRFLKEQALQELIDFGDLPVFEGAITYPCILILRKAGPQLTFFVTQVKTLKFANLYEYVIQERYAVAQTTLNDKSWVLNPDQAQFLVQKLQKVGISLEAYTHKSIRMGITTGLNEAFVIDEQTAGKIIEEDAKNTELIKPFIIGRDVKRYALLRPKQYLIFLPNHWTEQTAAKSASPWNWFGETYPALAKHFAPFAEAAQKRADKGKCWWELRACDYYAAFEKPKIIYPSICKRPEFTFDASGLYANQKCFIIPCADKYLLGLLNSAITAFLFNFILPKLRGGFYEPSYIYLKDFPIKTINFADPQEKAQHNQIVSLVEEQLDLNQKLTLAEESDSKNLLEQQIKATDEAIDSLVFELYGLTSEEVALVKQETQISLKNKRISFLASSKSSLLEKMQKKGVSLEIYTQKKIRRGLITGLNAAFVLDERTRARIITEDPKSVELIKPFLIGREVKRYNLLKPKQYLIFLPNHWTRLASANNAHPWAWFAETYPALAKHLAPFSEAAQKRANKGEFWWELQPCAFYEALEKPKIVYPNICKRPEFTFDPNSLYVNQKCFIIPCADKYLLGLLNSSVTAFLFSLNLPKLRGGFYEPSYIYLKSFPIKTINFAEPQEKAHHDQIVSLVEKLLELQQQLAAAKTAHQKTLLESQINAIDKAVDSLVYELYALTQAEIALVEAA